jgi:hypothetical protein
MSMCGEVENLRREIEQKELELASLKQRLWKLNKVINDDRQLDFNMELDPDLRNWVYDGDGRKIPREV